ncbi:hypothetical protein [Pseudooceanicola nanhaiensis]|uniref:hypothetical protein n=1 Tax=Pseudooceanicola nanhaiensis TaxID=375761 RepID=UPI001CD76146|nr:hypothetical protein [Pseudooceanicola nanhaiensis]MCA0919366.1 hypothetical protein [Pseudooceanicola nanhaiensis]
MQIILHAGAHATDEDRLMKTLLRNKQEFLQRGVLIPGPSKYRRLLRDALHGLAYAPPTLGARGILLDAILEEEEGSRMVLSNDNFFCVPKLAVGPGGLYPMAEEKLRQFCALFPEDEIHLFLALRNPATFLPALFNLAPDDDLAAFLSGYDPMQLRWSDMIERIQGYVPRLKLTVWSNEDTPFLWAQIIRAMADLPTGQKITGGFDLLIEIMSREGMQRFRAYLKAHPNLNDPQKHRVMAAFLDKYALEGALEEELDLPGWDEQLIEDLTEEYDADCARIAAMEGVRFLST